MTNEQIIYFTILIFFGFILLGLAGFMYDRITSDIPKEDESIDIRAPNRKLSSVFNAPFVYIYQNLKEKNFKALFPFSVYIFVLIYIIILIKNLILAA
ncbi:MAG: hypothetical protein MJ179_11675 [Treponema sp.]|nr:hypothetical protein [Treponema sp.]